MTRRFGFAAAYAAATFALGFAAGLVRVLLVEPRFGGVAAMAWEIVIMAPGAWLIAGAVMRRHGPATLGAAAAIGLIALALILLAETVFALGVLGLSPGDYIAGYDPLRGAIFPLLLVWFAATPALRRIRPR